MQADILDRLTHVPFSREASPNLSGEPRANDTQSGQNIVLRGCDIFISLAAVIYLLPIFLIIAALIYLEDGGPVFFVQTRIGRNGKPFPCLKFRSMRVAGDEIFRRYLESSPQERANWQQFRKLERDPRLTFIGRVLRKTSLDEFPQLINVIKGEMSLVGPRPITPDEVRAYGTSYRYYAAQTPGITGLWQVMGRNQLTYFKRVALDRVLSRKMSIGVYFRILVMTIPAVLLQRGAR